MNKGNIVLIGMPSSGKSTIGSALAEELKKGFVDIDSIIACKANKSPKDIVNEDGLEKFLEIQEKAVLELSVKNHVIATGGSIVYNTGAMTCLKESGMVIYLKLPYSDIESRVEPGRRFARHAEKTFKDIYNERVPLYEKYADITIECKSKDVDTIINEIKKVI